jgi:hypothetical protein
MENLMTYSHLITKSNRKNTLFVLQPNNSWIQFGHHLEQEDFELADKQLKKKLKLLFGKAELIAIAIDLPWLNQLLEKHEYPTTRIDKAPQLSNSAYCQSLEKPNQWAKERLNQWATPPDGVIKQNTPSCKTESV